MKQSSARTCVTTTQTGRRRRDDRRAASRGQRRRDPPPARPPGPAPPRHRRRLGRNRPQILPRARLLKNRPRHLHRARTGNQAVRKVPLPPFTHEKRDGQGSVALLSRSLPARRAPTARVMAPELEKKLYLDGITLFNE